MRALPLLLAACVAPPPQKPDPAPATDTPPTDVDTDTTDTTDADTTDTTSSTIADHVGVLVLAGGGTEGDVGDAEAWSARLYGELLSGGDISGDGRVEVAILASDRQTEWLPDYFRHLGADDAYNVLLDTAAAADAPDLAAQLAHVDVFFLKGGDQGVYYDLWNDRAIEAEILRVHAAGGGVGGTSAGAMSLAGVALAGGMDLVSADVLTDACTPYLDDASDGGSGLHDDFLGLVPGAVIDTHFTVRGRLGRLAGALARAVDDGLPAGFALGVDERTGVVVRGGVGTVIGVGAVSLLRAEPGASALTRTCGRPLLWTALHLDQLVDGWSFDLRTLAVTPGAGAEAVAWDGVALPNAPGGWWVDGDLPAHEERFGWVVGRGAAGYGTRPGADLPVQQDTLGAVDANASDRRGPAFEGVMRALHDHVGATGLLVGYGGSVERHPTDDDVVRFVDNPEVGGPEEATLVIESAALTARDLSPAPSNLGVDGLHAAGLAGLRLHVLWDTDRTGFAYDTASRALLGP